MNDTFEKLLNKIILEISFKSDNGMIEFNESNRNIVKKYLKEYLDDSEINEMLTKLSEDYEVKRKDGSGGSYDVKNYDPSKHTLIKKIPTKKDTKPKTQKISKEIPISKKAVKQPSIKPTTKQPKVDDKEPKDSLKLNTNELDNIHSKIYNKNKLLQSSDDALSALNNGYVAGASYVAPGNAGSNFNENMSNEVAMILQYHPDLTEGELAYILYKNVNESKLAKQQKTIKIQGGGPYDIPTDIKNKDIYKACIIASRSGMSKKRRMNNDINSLGNKIDKKSIQTKVYGGTKSDLSSLTSEISKAKTVYIVDNGIPVKISKDNLVEWVQASGGGENAADTAVISVDKSGNLIYNGWSDKMALDNIQSNSTLNEEYTTYENLANEFVTDDTINKKVVNILQVAKSKVSKLEDNYANAIYTSAGVINNEYKNKNDKNRLVTTLVEQFNDYNKQNTTNHISGLLKKVGAKDVNKPTTDEMVSVLDYILTNDNMTSNERKVLARMIDVEKKYLKTNNKDMYDKIDPANQISKTRLLVLNYQKKVIDDLNKIKTKSPSGKTINVGDLLHVNYFIKALHLDKINKPKELKDYLKRSTQLIMGGIDVDSETLKSCMNVKDTTDLIDNFSLETDERIIKDIAGENITGKAVALFMVDKVGKRIYVGDVRYRSKDGVLGKTSNTMQWSPDIQSCFDKKYKIKK